MKLTDGAASSWANLRSATLLMLTNRRHLPVVNRPTVSEQANDWIDMGEILPVNRVTVNVTKIWASRKDAPTTRGWPC
jgi:hypothetical protein